MAKNLMPLYPMQKQTLLKVTLLLLVRKNLPWRSFQTCLKTNTDTSYAFLKEIFFQEEVRFLWLAESLQFLVTLFSFLKTLCTSSTNDIFWHRSFCSYLAVFGLFTWSLQPRNVYI